MPPRRSSRCVLPASRAPGLLKLNACCKVKRAYDALIGSLTAALSGKTVLLTSEKSLEKTAPSAEAEPLEKTALSVDAELLGKSAPLVVNKSLEKSALLAFKGSLFVDNSDNSFSKFPSPFYMYSY